MDKEIRELRLKILKNEILISAVRAQMENSPLDYMYSELNKLARSSFNVEGITPRVSYPAESRDGVM